jgi:exodeoxyribonuclease VII large subunit
MDPSLKIEPATKDRVFTVSEFLDFLNNLLRPCRVIVRGEIGERINTYPNYIFFNLLDKQGAILKCFAFRNIINNLGVEISPGMEIKVLGYPDIRKNRGELKFQVERIELLGEGILKRQFEVLKKKLETLGFFDQKFKKPIPRFSQNIGLITSKYGKGAKRDFLTHLGDFGFRIFFYDTRMEGSFALYEIIEAISWFNQNLPKIDVLVITRGGGSWESLQPFNSEEIVKAIFSSKIPIITGIGHENDTTLADFAADIRASTPTHAARILNENWRLAKIQIKEFENNFNFAIKKIFKHIKEKIVFLKKNLLLRVKREVGEKQKGLKEIMKNLNFAFLNYLRDFEALKKEFQKRFLDIERRMKEEQSKINQYSREIEKNRKRWEMNLRSVLIEEEKKLSLSSPLLKLKQGYTITFDGSGKIIKDPTNLKLAQIIKTKFFKGQIFSKIKRIEK